MFPLTATKEDVIDEKNKGEELVEKIAQHNKFWVLALAKGVENVITNKWPSCR